MIFGYIIYTLLEYYIDHKFLNLSSKLKTAALEISIGLDSKKKQDNVSERFSQTKNSN